MEHIPPPHSRARDWPGTRLASVGPHLPARPAPRTPQTVHLPARHIRTIESDGSYGYRLETSPSASSTEPATSLNGLQDARVRPSRDLEAQDRQSGRLDHSRIQARDARKLSAAPHNNPFRSSIPVSMADITTITYDSEPPERQKYEGKALRLLVWIDCVIQRDARELINVFFYRSTSPVSVASCPPPYFSTPSSPSSSPSSSNPSGSAAAAPPSVNS